MADDAQDTMYFADPAAFRRWLKAHHARADEQWVGYHKRGTGVPSMTWPESVDEALCYGWIDGLRRSVDDARYRIRFTPRRPKSVWSTKNIARVKELIEEGRMRPAGLAAWKRREEDRSRRYSFEQGKVALPMEFLKLLKSDAKAWSFFSKQPPGYRKQATWWVISAKREETRKRRLATLIDDSAAGVRIAPLRRTDG